jgi:N-acetylneuraminate synthase
MKDGLVDIAGRLVGPGRPCYIIAEAGVNHNGDPALARRLIEAAQAAGADAVKFQTFKTDRLLSPLAPKAAYQLKTTDATESQLEMLRRLELPFDVFRELSAHSHSRGITFLSSPFDAESADYLAGLGVPAFKIPSGEITNLPLLAHLARKNRPLILSTGMSCLDEVAAAVRTIRETGNDDTVLLHCVSTYPARPEDVNLRAMLTMQTEFGTPVGYSDHTQGIEISLAAVALGACVLEKHFTLDRGLPGPDHQASLEPAELAQLIRAARGVQSALGHGRKEPAACEADSAAAGRKSLVAACDIPAGAALTDAMVAILRPGTGLPPSQKKALLGRRTRKPIPRGTLLRLDMLE